MVHFIKAVIRSITRAPTNSAAIRLLSALLLSSLFSTAVQSIQVKDDPEFTISRELTSQSAVDFIDDLQSHYHTMEKINETLRTSKISGELFNNLLIQWQHLDNNYIQGSILLPGREDPFEKALRLRLIKNLQMRILAAVHMALENPSVGNFDVDERLKERLVETLLNMSETLGDDLYSYDAFPFGSESTWREIYQVPCLWVDIAQTLDTRFSLTEEQLQRLMPTMAKMVIAHGQGYDAVVLFSQAFEAMTAGNLNGHISALKDHQNSNTVTTAELYFTGKVGNPIQGLWKTDYNKADFYYVFGVRNPTVAKNIKPYRALNSYDVARRYVEEHAPEALSSRVLKHELNEHSAVVADSSKKLTSYVLSLIADKRKKP